MSTTTHVSPVSGVPPRLAELAKGLGKRLRCLVSSPPSLTVSLANPLADTFLELRLSGSSRPAHPRNHAGLMIPSRPGRRPAGPNRKRGGRAGRRFFQTTVAQVGVCYVTCGDAHGLDRRFRCVHECPTR